MAPKAREIPVYIHTNLVVTWGTQHGKIADVALHVLDL